MQMKKGPIVLMLLTAVLTYEGLSRLMPDSPTGASNSQLQGGVAALTPAPSKAPAPYMTPAQMQTQPVMNPYQARSMKKKRRHAQTELAKSSTAARGNLAKSPIGAAVTAIGAIANMGNSANGSSGAGADAVMDKIFDPDSDNTAEMTITAPTTEIELKKDVDLHMVPQVIVLPKMEEAQVAPPIYSNRNMKNLAKSYN
jgi:hypothetical protein